MKKLTILWQKIPAKYRFFINILTSIVCVFVMYVSLGSPPFSVEDAFRRAEKANFVGPSEILAQIRPDGTPYSHLVLARDPKGVTVFTYDFWDSELTDLVYVPKTGGLTLVAAPGKDDWSIQNTALVPLVLFDDNPRAVRAEVDLSLSGTFANEACAQSYHLTAQREFKDLFLFTIEAASLKPLWDEGYLLSMLQKTADNSAAIAGVHITAAVRLYDDGNVLIDQQNLTLCP